MKRQWRGFVSGMLVALMVVGVMTTAFAAYQKQATLNYSGIQITLDGETVNPTDANGKTVEPFAIDGTTYLPVRAIANALNMGVEWDGATQTVKLTSGKTTAVGSGESGYSRKNPAPVGTAQTVTVDNYSYKYTASVVLTETIRGNEALKMVKAANAYLSDPAEGMEYIVVKAKVTIDSVSEDKAISLSKYSFDAYNAENVEYDDVFAYVADDFSGNVFEGGTLEGSFVVQVAKSDASPKLVFGAKYDGSGGIWFDLK